MSRTPFSLVTSILLFLSVLNAFTTALYTPFHLFTLRQAQIGQTTCAEYSTIANLSTIGSNATYRAAYLQASPEGGDPARAPLDSAMLQLPSLKFDVDLNDQCGNLTEVAFAGAESNFTQGIVLQFRVNAAVQVGTGAVSLAVLMGLVALTVIDGL